MHLSQAQNSHEDGWIFNHGGFSAMGGHHRQVERLTCRYTHTESQPAEVKPW